MSEICSCVPAHQYSFGVYKSGVKAVLITHPFSRVYVGIVLLQCYYLGME